MVFSAICLTSDFLIDEQVRGHIMVFNSEWQGNYGETVVYRSQAANRSSVRGAVATLVRSVTEYSIASPHTGTMVNICYQ